ncbi:MAG TPA: TetR/AcrR family transcriptional regulator [Solirubrobacterales bacterium]|nr:TetR/AcrR family transcriptional regulator [Solirubrobacterales bacterium]
MAEGKADKRAYRMDARAKATEATRERILEASEAVFDELPFDEITLAEVAKRAEVSVQTVLRHFESKDGLFLASVMHSGAKMAASRELQPVGSPEEMVDSLIDHYEEFGDRIIHVLAQEDRVPTLRLFTDLGRQFHLEWCEQAFAPALKGLRGAKRERRIAQFATATDIYVWKLLRRDRQLGLAQTKLAVRELLEPLLA